MTRILQISTADVGGGAEAVAANLHAQYRALGHDAWLLVGRRTEPAAGVLRLANHPGTRGWSRWWWALDDRLADRRFRGHVAARRVLRLLADPLRLVDQRRGREPMRFPGTWRLRESIPARPDIVHAHNLHGGYFDLRALPFLSRQQPLVMTLHDSWLLSGHCAYAMACERWQTGCGHCPDLTRYPSLPRDGTAENWRRKQALYAQSRLYLATPSRWLMEMVERSMLAPAIARSRVIPYGIDRQVFHPGDRAAARHTLGLPPDGHMLLFVANRGRQNVYKDHATIEAAVARLALAERREPLLLVALGGAAPDENVAGAVVRHLPYERDPHRVAAYYQAADLYLHAAHADNFPNTVLEALACGTPVVATAVGGIPEQVDDGQTGYLTPPGDAPAMAAAVDRLLADDDLRARFGQHAARQAAERFDLNRQVQDYLACYAEAQADFAAQDPVVARG